MNPSPQAVAAIRAEVADWTPSDAAIAANLNAPGVPNPVPQGTVARPYTVASILSLITTSAANLKVDPFLAVLTDVRDKIQAADAAGIGLYANLLLSWGVIVQAEHDAILAAIAATEPDPTWQSQISWAQANLGRPVDTDDIAASRPGA